MPRQSGSNALPGLMLVIIVIWALSAVLMLTSTLSAADRIDKNVTQIRADVEPIDEKLQTVPVLSEVEATAEAIREAAAPLTGQLANVAEDVVSIDASAKSILVSAESINGRVHEINTTAREINSTVHPIGASISEIEGTVGQIHANVVDINDTFVSVEGFVQNIRANLVMTSKQVDVLNGYINGIKQDTGTISTIVDQINANAQAIRNSPVILDPANAQVMHQAIQTSAFAPPGTAGVPNLDGLLEGLTGLGGPLPSVSLTDPLPVLGLPLLDLPLLGDTGSLLSVL